MAARASSRPARSGAVEVTSAVGGRAQVEIRAMDRFGRATVPRSGQGPGGDLRDAARRRVPELERHGGGGLDGAGGVRRAEPAWLAELEERDGELELLGLAGQLAGGGGHLLGGGGVLLGDPVEILQRL